MYKGYVNFETCHECDGEGVFSYECRDCGGVGSIDYNGHIEACNSCKGSGRFYPKAKPEDKHTRDFVISSGKTIKVYDCKKCQGKGSTKINMGQTTMMCAFEKYLEKEKPKGEQDGREK